MAVPTSTTLIKTLVLLGQEPRSYYLSKPDTVEPPWIAHSRFISSDMVEHLMRRKKDSAIAVKFVAKSNTPDAITNMEGVLHTFVTPVVKAAMHGVYAWRGGHDVVPFGPDRSEGTQMAMPCLISALIHPDFELASVMVAALQISNEDKSGRGAPSMPRLISVEKKQDTLARASYDDGIRRFLIGQLTAGGYLPSISEIQAENNGFVILNVVQTIEKLDGYIRTRDEGSSSDWEVMYLRHKNRFLSLEMLLNVHVEQVRNEFTILTNITKDSGFIYTYNPPSIFASWLNSEGRHGDGMILLSLIWLLALKQLAREEKIILSGCRCIAWDTFVTPSILPMIRNALGALSRNISVISTADLFEIDSLGTTIHEDRKNPFFRPPPGCEDAIVVLHNNSDAFGQNAETEHATGSLDGAIGANSSLAASILRSRKDLCSRLSEVRRV